MGWDFWDKGSSRGPRIPRKKNKLYRNPFTGGLEEERQDTSSWSHQDRWDKNKCTGNKNCGSGQSCIDGQCVKVHTRSGGNFKPNSCGEDPVEWAPCKPGNDTGGSKDKCMKPTPGNCEKEPDCPGVKCCREQRDGSIRCVCGDCEQTDTAVCNTWCDSQYKSFGTAGPGCFTKDMEGFGECGGNICDECEFCDNNIFGDGGICTLGEQGGLNPLACHCFPSCKEECHSCDKDKDSDSFGECEYEPAECAECCETWNYECPQCNIYFRGVETHCEPVTSGLSCIEQLRARLFSACRVLCDSSDGDDPCDINKIGQNTSYCYEGAESDFICPEGKRCTLTGRINGPTSTCDLYNIIDPETIPPQCQGCDCNCDNDCGDCEICNASGICEPDPECEDDHDTYKVELRWTGITVVQSSCQVIDKATRPEGSWQQIAIGQSREDLSKWQIKNFVTGPSGLVPTYPICGRACPGTYTYSSLYYDDSPFNPPGFQVVSDFSAGCSRSSGNNSFWYDQQMEIRFIKET